MSGSNKGFDGAAWLTIKDWLVLNMNELTWIALVGCGVLLVGMFMG